MKAWSPLDGEWYFFVDKCMPFGAVISCSHFQKFSDAVAHVMRTKSGRDLVNYLDDYLFIALFKMTCNGQIDIFLQVCAMIRFPVSPEKTFWALTCLVFLGLLIDTVAMTVSVPIEKVERALKMIEEILAKKGSQCKVTVWIFEFRVQMYCTRKSIHETSLRLYLKEE